jgi:hypothetical protein
MVIDARGGVFFEEAMEELEKVRRDVSASEPLCRPSEMVPT